MSLKLSLGHEFDYFSQLDRVDDSVCDATDSASIVKTKIEQRKAGRLQRRV
jgi:hypothetical protein